MNYQAIIDFWLRLYRDFLFFAIYFKLQITEYAKTIFCIIFNKKLVRKLLDIRNIDGMIDIYLPCLIRLSS